MGEPTCLPGCYCDDCAGRMFNPPPVVVPVDADERIAELESVVRADNRIIAELRSRLTAVEQERDSARRRCRKGHAEVWFTDEQCPACMERTDLTLALNVALTALAAARSASDQEGSK